jgi:DtxR family Mn-dependent transcriptional regulator
MFFRRKESERILFEDSLKHIYDCEYRKVEATILSLAGSLRLKDKKVVRIVSIMEKRGLVRVLSDGIHLTPHGRAWALQVIRAHRLWESYLVDQVGLPINKIHEEAEHKEHSITPAEADQLEAQLGYPRRDPHGDPIPSATHSIDQKKGVSLVDWPVNKLARIIHIEDEPKTILEQILAEGLLLDTCIKILKSDDSGLHLWTNVHECWLAPVVAANIFVEEAPKWMAEISGEPLNVLKPGECGTILALKSQGLNRRRFLDLGLLPGTVVEAVMPSALAEPLAYKVRETLIALRHEQTQQILIKRINP